MWQAQNITHNRQSFVFMVLIHIVKRFVKLFSRIVITVCYCLHACLCSFTHHTSLSNKGTSLIEPSDSVNSEGL
jgi:hypothetical protein